jgi:hypothetical protein
MTIRDYLKRRLRIHALLLVAGFVLAVLLAGLIGALHVPMDPLMVGHVVAANGAGHVARCIPDAASCEMSEVFDGVGVQGHVRVR